MKFNIPILLYTIAGIIIISCNNNGKQAETKNTKKVEIIKKSTTLTFKNIKNGSFLSWRASHLGGLQPRFGKIFFKDASFFINNNILTNAFVSIDMSTLTVENFPKEAEKTTELTNHLQSADFFNIEKYPISKFELTNLESTAGVYNSKVTGNLTILEITKSISFNANINISDNEVSIKSEKFFVNRIDWGLSYNTKGTAGVPVDYLIANKIDFTINITLTR
jgi:hypothetical protein